MYLHPFFYKYRERVGNTDLSLLQVRLENSQMDLSVLNKPQIPVVNPIINPAFVDNKDIFSKTDLSVFKTKIPEPVDVDKRIQEMSNNIDDRAGLRNEAHCSKATLSKPRVLYRPPPPAVPGGDSPIDHSFVLKQLETPLFRRMGPKTVFYLQNHETLIGMDKIYALCGLEAELFESPYPDVDLSKIMKRNKAAFLPQWESTMRQLFNLQRLSRMPFHVLGKQTELVEELLGKRVENDSQ